MAEYIKREDAIRVVEKYFTDWIELNPDICLDGIRSLPAADVVEVVRCKDCIHRPQCENYLYDEMPNDDYFCKYGKRKVGDDG